MLEEPSERVNNSTKSILMQAYEHKSIEKLEKQYKKSTDIIANAVKQKLIMVIFS